MSADAPGAAAAPPSPSASDAEAVLAGTVLAGRYRIVRKLGEGAMGDVYLGEHLRIGRRDAIKVLRPSLAADPEAMARFARGARNVSAIQHPNVCTVYDFGDMEDGRRFLAMEYVPGETLQDLLAREGRLHPGRAVAIAARVADALQAAHDAGIVHRDLKPGNVMVSPARGGGDAVKVVDFDIAKGSAEGQPGDVTRLGFVIGTPEYMSPEQLLGAPLDGRSDVYSLALVLFRMLAGALPFRARDTQELMVQRLTGAPLRLDEVLPGLGVPPALQAALDRALQRRAEDRHASAAEFAADITRAIGDGAASAVRSMGEIPSSPPSPIPQPAHATPGGELTRGGVPLTVLTPEGGAGGDAPPVRPTARVAIPAGRAALVMAVFVVLAGGAWGAARVLGPPRGEPVPPVQPVDAGPGVAPRFAGASKQGAGPGETQSQETKSREIQSPSAQSQQTVPPATTSAVAPPPISNPPATRVETQRVATVQGTPNAREPEIRRQPASQPTSPRDAPVVDASPPRRAGVTADNAPQLARRLSSYLTRDLSPGEVSAIADSARRVMDLGGDVPAAARANAAFVLGQLAYRTQDWGACVRWMERAQALNPAARGPGLLLATCREHQE